MLELRNYSIKRKLTWMNMLVSCAALLVASTAFLAYELVAFSRTMVRNLSIQAQMVASSSASALLFSDPESAGKTLSALRVDPNVLYGGIYTPGGEPFAMYWLDRNAEVVPPLPAFGNQIEAHWFTNKHLGLIRSIVFQGKRIGTVYIRSDLRELKGRLTLYVGIVAIVLLMSLMAALVLSSPFQRTLARPIVQLAEIAGIVSREKNYSVRAPASQDHDEIAILIEAFNEMLAQIQRRDADLQQAHERLNLALKSSGVGTWSLLIAENTVIWDDYIPPLFGLESGMFSGKYEDFLNLVHPEDRERLRNRVADSIERNDSYNAEFRVIWPDGSIHALSARGKVYCDQMGRAMRMTGVCWDISERKRAEEERKALLASEQEARRTAELLNRVGPMLLGELDLKKLTQKVSDLATQLSGAQFGAFSRVVVNGNGTSQMAYIFSGALREAFGDVARPQNTDVPSPGFSERTIVRSDDITKHAGEGKFPFEMSDRNLPVRSYLGVPVVSRSGEVMGALSFGHCSPAMFTERHEQLVLGISAQAAIAIDNAHLFEQVREGRLRAEETSVTLRRVNSDLEQFVYSAYHDLHEPLRMVSIYTQKLKKEYGGKLGPVADLYIRYTVQGSKRMEQLVRDLVTYTESARDSLEPVAPLETEVALASAISSLQGALTESAASISHECLPRVKMLRAHLEQVFLNLIANAIKYRGEEPPKIKIQAERGQTEWIFSVQDNGIGIDPQYGEHIFGLFKRLHSAEEYSGTGIGLAICRKIVQRYGGRIWVESELRKGATFFFAVPDGEAQTARE